MRNKIKNLLPLVQYMSDGELAEELVKILHSHYGERMMDLFIQIKNARRQKGVRITQGVNKRATDDRRHSRIDYPSIYLRTKHQEGRRVLRGFILKQKTLHLFSRIANPCILAEMGFR